MSNQKKGVLLALVTVICWGFLAIGLKVALNKLEPLTIVWFRFSMAFLALFIWYIFTDRSQLKILFRPPLLLVFSSLALSANYVGFMEGVRYTSPSNAQVVIQLGPILLAIVGFIFFNEKIKRGQFIGFGVAFIGFILFYYEQLTSLIKDRENFTIGVLFTLFAAISWAIYAVIQKKLVNKYPPQTTNLFIYALPSLLFFPFADLTPLADFTIEWWFLLLFLGANTLIAYGCFASSLKYIEANKVSMIIITNPIITFITMWILSTMNVTWIPKEHFEIKAIIGIFMFLFGAILVVKERRG